MNVYGTHGYTLGTNPLTRNEMIKEFVEPLLGKDFKTYQWGDEGYDELRKLEAGELIYKSLSGQGYATYYREAGVLRTSVLEDYMIQGLIFTK